MTEQPLQGKTILVTATARRLGRIFSLVCARVGADIVIHHGHSKAEADPLLDGGGHLV